MEIKRMELGAIFLFLILLYYSYRTIMPILDAIVIAIVITYLVRPIYNSLGKKIKYEGLAVLLAMVSILVPLFLIGIYTLNELVSTFDLSDIVEIIDISFSNIDTLMESFFERYLFFMDFESLSQSTIDAIAEKATELGILLYEYILDITLSIPVLLFKFILAAVLAFYFLKDGYKFKKRLVGIVPLEFEDKFNKLVGNTDILFQAVIVGYLFKAIFTGIISVVIYYFLGIPHFLLLGIFTGIIDFIPLIGPWMVQIALFVWYLYQDQYSYAILILLVSYFFISFIPEMYIRPRISGAASQIHPVIILIGAIGGLFAFGAIGIIIGPMILGVIYVILRIYFYNESYEQIQFGYKDTLINFVKGVLNLDK